MYRFVYSKMQLYYTYVLRSDKDNRLYVGFTGDINKRIAEHNKGLVDATSKRLPLRLIYFEAGLSKSKAIQREKYFKTGFGRRFLKERLGLDTLPNNLGD